eukprot:scaffold431_cov334-Pavlova_lutheri.AAC.124
MGQGEGKSGEDSNEAPPGTQTAGPGGNVLYGRWRAPPRGSRKHAKCRGSVPHPFTRYLTSTLAKTVRKREQLRQGSDPGILPYNTQIRSGCMHAYRLARALNMEHWTFPFGKESACK